LPRLPALRGNRDVADCGLVEYGDSCPRHAQLAFVHESLPRRQVAVDQLKSENAMNLFEWIFLAEFTTLMTMRFWFARGTRAKNVVRRQLDVTERALLLGTLVGMTIVPLIYFGTQWLAFADYDPPQWLGWLGVPLAVATVVLFWRSHADLGTNWSATLEIREQQALVSTGVYRYVRHPMYASIWLWALSQALLVPNWLVGAAGIISFATLYFLRVPREEQMMIDAFGDDYVHYMRQTGRLVPTVPFRR
jgi:protein-S-isoprenylcysteine O-methyltransferase Ste14